MIVTEVFIKNEVIIVGGVVQITLTSVKATKYNVLFPEEIILKPLSTSTDRVNTVTIPTFRPQRTGRLIKNFFYNKFAETRLPT